MTATDKQLAQYMEQIRAKVAKYGHVVQCVFPVEPDDMVQFSYTVGLTAKYGHELILFAADPKVGRSILNSIADTMALGIEIPLGVKLLPAGSPGAPVDTPNDWANVPVILRMCDRDLARMHLNVARSFYGRDVDAIQVVVPDKALRFPGEPGYNFAAMQPLLYRENA